jgi:hypothetical protein
MKRLTTRIFNAGGKRSSKDKAAAQNQQLNIVKAMRDAVRRPSEFR